MIVVIRSAMVSHVCQFNTLWALAVRVRGQ